MVNPRCNFFMSPELSLILAYLIFFLLFYLFIFVTEFQYVAQADFEPVILLPSASQVLGLQLIPACLA
jgi:hypothetical protein